MSASCSRSCDNQPRLFRQMQRLLVGVALYRSGDFASAVRTLEAAVNLNPRESVKNTLLQAYTEQGILAYRRNQLPEAVAAWENALRISPDPAIQRYLDRARKKLIFMKEILRVE